MAGHGRKILHRLREAEAVLFYGMATTRAGRLHRFVTVLSIVSLVWVRVARQSYQRYGFRY